MKSARTSFSVASKGRFPTKRRLDMADLVAKTPAAALLTIELARLSSVRPTGRCAVHRHGLLVCQHGGPEVPGGDCGRLRSVSNRHGARAPPVRRVHIPKGDGQSTRPIGIPTFEDKVLQRAVLMVLEPLYEQDFLDCSYGFRPRRSAHQALDSF